MNIIKDNNFEKELTIDGRRIKIGSPAPTGYAVSEWCEATGRYEFHFLIWDYESAAKHGIVRR